MNTSGQLTAYLAQHQKRPFSWRAANCCHFAARWKAFATGRDPMAGLAATRSVREALRLVRALGGSMQAAWTRQLGREPIAPALAQLGDLMLLPTAGTQPGTGCVMGICTGVDVLVLADDGVPTLVPASQAKAAWRLRDEVHA